MKSSTPFSLNDFPLLKNQALSYLDNAATTQKPQAVIDAVVNFYEQANAPVHRGIYSLAENATEQFEAARKLIAQYCGAAPEEIVFTQGATSGINLVASGWASRHLGAGDEILISELEHHSNLLPWLRLEQEKGCTLVYIPVKADGTLDYDAYTRLLSKKTKLVAVTHTSNVLGTRVAIPFIIESARTCGAATLVDATQAAGREHLQLNRLGADFVVFSGHKMLGPTGIGVLYGSRERLEEMVPYELGGGMVRSVEHHSYRLAKVPHKFEAGTPPIAQAIGLGAAVSYLTAHSFEDLRQHEAALCARLIAGLERLKSITILGPVNELKQSGHIVSFVSSKAHAHDIAAFLDRATVCVRAGNHCAQPLHQALGIVASVRASFYGYTQEEDITKLIEALESLEKSF